MFSFTATSLRTFPPFPIILPSPAILLFLVSARFSKKHLKSQAAMCYKGTSELPYCTPQLYSVPSTLLSLQAIAGPALTTHFLYFLHCLICSFFPLFSLQFSLQLSQGLCLLVSHQKLFQDSSMTSWFYELVDIFLNLHFPEFTHHKFSASEVVTIFLFFVGEHFSFCRNTLAQSW